MNDNKEVTIHIPPMELMSLTQSLGNISLTLKDINTTLKEIKIKLDKEQKDTKEL